MERLHVTDSLIGAIIGEVAPRVEEATQWPLVTASLRWRVLPRDQGYEEILLGRLRGAGVPIRDDDPRGLLDRLIEYVVESNVLGAYQPSTSELLIVRENVDDSNLDGLKVVVAHELVHRGQHLYHGHLFDRADATIAKIFRGLDSGDLDFRAAWKMVDTLKPIMTLIESHAYYVQELIRQTHYPDAVIESHLNLASLLLRLFGRKKIMQYRDGVPAVADAVSRGDIQSLYSALQPG